MKVPEFNYGAIAPTFTIFNEDGSFDPAGQCRFLDFLLELGGINAFFLRSGMGQMYTFSMEDTKAMARAACRHLAGKAPALIGCSGIWDRNYDRLPDPAVYLEEALELSKYAADQGAAGVVFTIPEGLTPAEGQSIEDLTVGYFEKVCAGVSCPVFFYQPPQTRAAYCLTPRTLSRMADVDNLVGGKVSSRDAQYLFDLIWAVKDKEFGFIVGAESAFYAGLVVGARACIGQGCTVNARIVKAVADRYFAGDLEGAVAAQADVNGIVSVSPNPVDFIKRMAAEKGYPVGMHARKMENNPYMEDRAPITGREYEAYKVIWEETLARYA